MGAFAEPLRHLGRGGLRGHGRYWPQAPRWLPTSFLAEEIGCWHSDVRPLGGCPRSALLPGRPGQRGGQALEYAGHLAQNQADGVCDDRPTRSLEVKGRDQCDAPVVLAAQEDLEQEHCAQTGCANKVLDAVGVREGQASALAVDFKYCNHLLVEPEVL